MSAPTPYSLSYDFTAFQVANPTTPLPADKLEIEFNNLETTTDEIIANLGLIQKSDGTLANGSVGTDQLSAGILAILGAGSGDISTVAGLDTEITALAALDTEITALGALTAELTAIGAITAELVALEADLTNVDTVAGAISNVNTVAGIAPDVILVGGISAAVSAVAAVDTEVVALAGLVVEITRLGLITGAISTAAANDANITIVAGIASEIQSVVGNITNINAVAANETNINAVAANETDISTVAGINTAVSTVAANDANISIVAANDADISTVAANDADISTVATDIASVVIVANNIATITDAANNIPKANRTATTDPTVNDDVDEGYSEGSVWVNTSTNTIFLMSDSSDGAAVWVNVTDVGLLSGLSDVDFTSLTAEDFIKYDGAKWVNRTPSQVRTDLSLVVGTNVQAYNANLTTYAGITPSANVQSLLGAADYSAMRTQLGLVIGTDVQAQDAELAAIAGLVSAADRLPYFTGSGTASLATFTAGGRALVNSAGTADTFPYFSASNTVTLGSITTAGRNLLDDADNTAQRTTLGLGTIATQNSNNVTITGGSVTGITDLAIVDGGTGASTASAAFTALKQAASETDTGVVERATDAEVVTGTDTTRYITPKQQADNTVFRKSFTSSNQTITAAGLLTLAHSLGAIPKSVEIWLECTTAENGYAIGDKILAMLAPTNQASTGFGAACYFDATNIYIRFGSFATTTFLATNQDTGAAVALTNASWQLIAKGWA